MLDSLLGSPAEKLQADKVAAMWKKHEDVSGQVELHKRRILLSRISNSLYPELHGLRETFLQHGLSDKSDANRRFFEKWLADPIVELGLTPAGGWTQARIAELHADLEGVRA